MTHSPIQSDGATGANFGPLEVRPDWPDVKRFRRRLRKERKPGIRQANAGLPLLILAVVPVFLLAWLAFWQIGARLGGTRIVPPVILALGVGAVALAWLVSLSGRSAWMRWYRLDGFAGANGLTWHITSPDPHYPGIVFQRGADRIRAENIETSVGRYLNLGEFRYTTGKGRNRAVHRWGFLALRLDHPLPHMVLDARATGGLLGAGRLPAYFARDQVLHLEGDFDRHFTLYCPKDYEQDALYLFTPDLMALFLDKAATLDAEIVDDWLFFYSARPFDIAHPQTMRRMLGVATAVGDRLAARAGRYHDDRPSIGAEPAAGGRRLRPRIPWLGIVVSAAAVAAILIFLL